MSSPIPRKPNTPTKSSDARSFFSIGIVMNKNNEPRDKTDTQTITLAFISEILGLFLFKIFKIPYLTMEYSE